MTDYNLLLAYLTELGAGTWAKFRQALDFVAGGEEIYRVPTARQLSALGHVEFAFGEDLRWSVCPPVLAWLPSKADQVAVLCGARSQPLEERVQALASGLGLHTRIHEQPGNEGPQAIFVAAPSRDAGDQLVTRAGIASEHNAASRIARCLPFIDHYMRLCEEAPEPSGYETEAFDTEQLRWKVVPQPAGEGLYRYHYYERREYRLKLDGQCLGTTSEIGTYLLLRRRRRVVLRYDGSREELLVPARTPLPELYARAAVLSSGFLPSFARMERPTHVYREVPANIAQAIMSRLGQTQEVLA